MLIYTNNYNIKVPKLNFNNKILDNCCLNKIKNRDITLNRNFITHRTGENNTIKLLQKNITTTKSLKGIYTNRPSNLKNNFNNIISNLLSKINDKNKKLYKDLNYIISANTIKTDTQILLIEILKIILEYLKNRDIINKIKSKIKANNKELEIKKEVLDKSISVLNINKIDKYTNTTIINDNISNDNIIIKSQKNDDMNNYIIEESNETSLKFGTNEKIKNNKQFSSKIINKFNFEKENNEDNNKNDSYLNLLEISNNNFIKNYNNKLASDNSRHNSFFINVRKETIDINDIDKKDNSLVYSSKEKSKQNNKFINPNNIAINRKFIHSNSISVKNKSLSKSNSINPPSIRNYNKSASNKFGFYYDKNNSKNKIYISKDNKKYEHLDHFDIDHTTKKRKY